MRTTFTIAALLLATTAVAQSPLSTLTEPNNNGLSGPPHGIYFDLEVLGANPLLLTDIAIEIPDDGILPTVDIWTCAGSHTAVDPISGLDPLNDPSVWTFRSSNTGNVPSVGSGTVRATTPIDIQNLVLNPGITGVFLVYQNTDMRYSGNGTNPPPASLATAELRLITGGSLDASGAVGTGYSFNPRLFLGELSYIPAIGLQPDFSQSAVIGPSPLAVTFTDTTFTDDPSGVSLVEFDFTNDGTFDVSTTGGGTANNSYGCGVFDVAIRATDTINGQATSVKTGAVRTDQVTADITQGGDLVGTGQTVNFSTNAPAGATVAWDFDGDGVTDSTNAVDTFVYNTGGTFTVNLDVSLNCNTSSATSTIEVVAGAIFSPGAAGGTTSFTSPPDASYFDVNVTNPAGYIVQEIFHRSPDDGAPHTMEVYIQTTPGQSVVGFEDANNFTLVSTGTAVAPATPGELFQIDVQDFILPPGVTGMAIVSRNSASGHTWYVANSGLIASNADISITPHSSSSNFDTASNGLTDPDSWAGGFIGTGVNDLFPDFTANVTAGASPLPVNFTDTTVTNDPAGVLSWAWDFQNDGSDDDFSQNPTFTYPTCGDFSVKLTVIDSINGPRTEVKNDFISTDPFNPEFTQDVVFTDGTTPVNFTYVGDPGALVTWDFDSDGSTDAVGANATFTFTTAGTFTTTMSATLNCRQVTVTGTTEVRTSGVITAKPGPTGSLTGFTSPPDASYIDLQVGEVNGITITDLLFRSVNTTDVVTYEIWGQLNRSVVGNYDDSNFTLLSSGTALANANDQLFLVDVADFALPVGTHGLAVVTASSPSSHRWYTNNQGISTTVDGVTLTPQGSNSSFTGATNTNISANGFSGGLVFNTGGANPMPGTVAKIADGCPGSLGQSDVQQGVNPPAIGTTYAVRITNVQAGVQLHGGISNTFNATFGVPLPFALGPVLGTQPDCNWFVSSEAIFLAFPNAFGEAVVSFPIPNNPAFQGLPVFYQGLIFDAASPGSIVTSNAYVAVVQ